jgi:MDMPI C-terminal domain
MLDLSPHEWEMPCAFFRHYGGHQPAQTFLFLIIQELVIHGWDIRSRFDEAATLAVESLPPLLERIPNRFPRLPGLSQFPIDTARWPFVRYRFALEADGAMRYDMVAEGGKARMEPAGKEAAEVTLRCDRATFVLMMYKRLTLDPAVAQGRVALEGDPALAAVFDQWLQQP